MELLGEGSLLNLMEVCECICFCDMDTILICLERWCGGGYIYILKAA